MQRRGLGAVDGPPDPVRVDAAYEAIVEMIMDRQVDPGSPLRVQALAARLGVSATPIREALARLEPTGLVERSARRGYRVAPLLTTEQLAQLVEARLVLEPANAERACARAGSTTVAALAEAVAAQRRASTGPYYSRYKDFMAADQSFHHLIADSSGNPFLLRASSSLGLLQRFRSFDSEVTDAGLSTAEHTRILTAFQARDPAGAAAAMRDHLDQLWQRVTRGE